MTQPKALRLADLIDWPSIAHGQEAAAELRRLHDLLGKANALCRIRHEIIQAREDECLTHSSAFYEATRLLSEAREQRDELLDALKVVIDDLMYKDHARVIDVALAAIVKCGDHNAT